MNEVGGPRAPLSRRERWVRTGWALADTCVVGTATWCAALLRFDFSLESADQPRVLWWVLLAMVVWLGVGLIAGPYLVRHERGSFEEVVDIGRAALLSVVVLVLVRLGIPWFDGVPRSLPLSTPIFGLLGMCALRLAVRSYRWGDPHARSRKRAVVFGAGEGGRQLVRALLRSDDSPYTPVAIIDDDPRKKRLRIDGVPVRGSRAKLPALVERLEPDALIIAMPAADSELIREVREQAQDLGLDVLTLPPVDALIEAGPQGADLRRINLEDLLGRRRVELDADAIAAVISGKRVLVTGAGGSIGAELARQVSRFGPAKLVLLDRDESALHAAQMSLTGRALLDDGTLALVDIRDRASLLRVFEHERPEIVFHAAALKHLTLLEQFPLEAFQTNVIGTRNVLDAAQSVDVETFVNISTDKAANPTCVLGYSKRIAERLTSYYASHRTDSVYVSVRFGNVLGSRGSVISAFTAQIERGGPVTVTHRDVERYFMLIPEACQLVLQASAIGRDGQVMVLDMGQPVKIVDVARTLIDLSGRNVSIEFTGLRPGEKMSEELFTPGDEIHPAQHPLVNYVKVPAAPPSLAIDARNLSPTAMRTWLATHATSSPEPVWETVP